MNTQTEGHRHRMTPVLWWGSNNGHIW